MACLRYHIAYLVLFSLVLSGSSLLVMQGAFVLRRGYIATHLCENRFDPHSHCDGLCYLKKELHEHENDPHDEQAAPRPMLDLVWDLPQVASHLARPAHTGGSFPLLNDVDTGVRSTTDIFHPPRRSDG